LRYQLEKEQYSVTVKEEQLAKTREHVARSESSFKDEVEKLRNGLLN
jgi:hypothetical protein